MNKNIKLFATVIPVKGVSRSALYDLHRQKFTLIPNALYHILVNHDGESKNKIISYYPDNEKIIEEYISFLISNEFAFLTPNPEMFPAIDFRKKETPRIISNTIVEITTPLLFDFETLIKQLDELGCQALELRILTANKYEDIVELLKHTQLSKLRSIELFFNYSPKLNTILLQELFKENPRIVGIQIFSSPEEKVEYFDPFSQLQLFYRKKKLKQGLVSLVKHTSMFAINYALFSEAQEKNTFFNQKVIIDYRGNILNSFQQDQAWGNINTDLLNAIVTKREFQKVWNLSKDKLPGCKDCEFRYMCVDERLPLIQEGNSIFKEECNYDPYLNKWNTSNV